MAPPLGFDVWNLACRKMFTGRLCPDAQAGRFVAAMAKQAAIISYERPVLRPYIAGHAALDDAGISSEQGQGSPMGRALDQGLFQFAGKQHSVAEHTRSRNTRTIPFGRAVLSGHCTGAD